MLICPKQELKPTQSFRAADLGADLPRPDLRAHFEVSAEYIAYAALTELENAGVITAKDLDKAAKDLNIERAKLDPAVAGPAQIRG